MVTSVIMASSQSRGNVTGEFDIAQVGGTARLERVESRLLRIERPLGLAPAAMRLRAAAAIAPTMAAGDAFVTPTPPVAATSPTILPPPLPPVPPGMPAM